MAEENTGNTTEGEQAQERTALEKKNQKTSILLALLCGGVIAATMMTVSLFFT